MARSADRAEAVAPAPTKPTKPATQGMQATQATQATQARMNPARASGSQNAFDQGAKH